MWSLNRVCGVCGYLLVQSVVWRIIGCVSCLVAFITYAMCSPFNKWSKLLGDWGFLLVVLYCALASLVFCMILCTTFWNLPKSAVLTAHASFFVLMISSAYSFYLEKTEEGNTKKDVLSLVSCGALSLMSLSLSRLTRLDFEAGVSNFFLGSLLMAVMKWNFKFTLGVLIFCYIFINLRSFTEFPPLRWQDAEAEAAAAAAAMPLIQNEERESLVVPTLGLAPLELRPPVMFDAFISYRAKDTSDIPEYLTCALLEKSLRVYAHQEITGYYVPPAVVKEIERAKVSVIIISESYLDATWCLDELYNIMACHARYEQIVIPIFYNINNVILQNSSGNFHWIENLCDANHVSTLDMHKWSFHLAEAAKMGWQMSRDGRPYEILDSVAKDVLSYCTRDQV